MSVLYAAITIVCVSAYIWSTRKAFKFQVVTGRSTAGHLQRLGSFRYLACLVCFAILFFEFILPFAGLVLMSSATIFASNLNSVHVNFPTFYLSALKIPLLFDSLRTTLLFGLMAAALATIVGALLSYSALKSKTRGARLADFVSAVPLAFPGVVYGVALFWTFLLIPGMNLLYGTIWPLGDSPGLHTASIFDSNCVGEHGADIQRPRGRVPGRWRGVHQDLHEDLDAVDQGGALQQLCLHPESTRCASWAAS